jgi:hypothetical protein
VAYCARTDAKHLSKRDCGIVSPGANRKGAGAHDYSGLSVYSTFDGLKNTAIQPVKQLG